MKIVLENGLPFISAVLTFQNKNIKLDNILLDTGSGGTIFPIDVVNSIGLKPEPHDEIHRIRGVGGIIGTDFLIKAKALIDFDHFEIHN